LFASTEEQYGLCEKPVLASISGLASKFVEGRWFLEDGYLTGTRAWQGNSIEWGITKQNHAFVSEAAFVRASY